MASAATDAEDAGATACRGLRKGSAVSLCLSAGRKAVRNGKLLYLAFYSKRRGAFSGFMSFLFCDDTDRKIYALRLEGEERNCEKSSKGGDWRFGLEEY